MGQSVGRPEGEFISSLKFGYTNKVLTGISANYGISANNGQTKPDCKFC